MAKKDILKPIRQFLAIDGVPLMLVGILTLILAIILYINQTYTTFINYDIARPLNMINGGVALVLLAYLAYKKVFRK